MDRPSEPLVDERIPRKSTPGPFPASFGQEGLWYWDQLYPETSMYNIAQGLHILGPLRRDLLERSLGLVVARHDALRTNFISNDVTPMQVVSTSRALRLDFADLSGVSSHDLREQANRLCNQEARRPFNLSTDLLIRAKLFRLGEAEHVLVLVVHHIVFDMWSLGVLYHEVSEAYRAFCEGGYPKLPELPIQYSDFAAWEREWRSGNALEALSSYWRSALGGEQEIQHLMLDHPRPAQPTNPRGYTAAIVPAGLVASLNRLSQRHRATQFMTFMAAFQTLLYRYSGHRHISVGFPMALRTKQEVSELVGYFVNTLVLKCDFSGDPTFAEVLGRVRVATLGAFLHQDMPFEKLVSTLSPERDSTRTPLFQVMFSPRNARPPVMQLPVLEITEFEPDTGAVKFDLTFWLEAKKDLEIALEYNREVFDTGTMERMSGHLLNLLKAVAENPDRPISNLPMLAPEEREQILVEWNRTSQPFPQSTVHELFEAQARKTPEAVAVEFEGTPLHYRELNERANQLAHYLRKMGVGPETLVAVAMERSLEMVVSLYGVLKAGGAYVPIDPDYPQERVAFMLQDAGAPVLLTQSRLLGRLPQHDGRVLCLDSEWEQVAHEEADNPPNLTTPENLAYVIYTSGSTGRPKGVMNTHRGICNRLLWMQDQYGLTCADKVLQKTPFSFDVSVWEFFWPLLVGARLIVAEPGGHRDAAYLVKLISEQGITVLHFVPPMLKVFLEEPEVTKCHSLRHVMCSGEALPYDLQEEFFSLLPSQLHNLYGPTEAAVDVTHWTCRRGDERKVVPIGRPLANTRIYLLDPRLQPVPIGVAGELHIGGVQVARGYHNRPELTAEKFIPDPFSGEPGARLYKTGDLCRWLEDGAVEYLGRMDFQVKIRGFRVELGEIERVLGGHPEVKSAVAVVIDSPDVGKQIIAYVVSRNGHQPSAHELGAYLKGKLPSYMVPSDFIFLETLPVTANGKIQRRGLPAPHSGETRTERQIVSPRDRVESELVRIWEDLLGKKPISIRDNFYDLGGHSLLAVRSVAAIERTFGQRLPLSTLIDGPTIEQLAVTLKKHCDVQSFSVVAIQTGGAKPPLYCVHGGGGEVLRFIPLARALGPEQPFYGLRFPEFDGNLSQVTIGLLAQRYIEEISRVQSDGPYYLSGASFGGLVALEMARQLKQEGREVALLVLFDTANPAFYHTLSPMESLKYRVRRLAGKLRYLGGNLWRATPGNKFRILAQTISSLRNRVSYSIWDATYRYFFWRQRPVPVRLRDNLKLFSALARAYRPQLYDGLITLFKAVEQSAEFGPDPSLGWACVARQGVDVHEVPGDHMTILDEPRVATLADRLRACIDFAQMASSKPLPVPSPQDPELNTTEGRLAGWK